MKKTFGILVVLVLIFSLNSAFIVHAGSAEGGKTAKPYVHSFEDILNHVNDLYGTDIEISDSRNSRNIQKLPQSEISYYLSYFEALARQISENNALVEELWYSRTGIPENEIVKYKSQPFSDMITPFNQSFVSTRRTWNATNTFVMITLGGTVTSTTPRQFVNATHVGSNSRQNNVVFNLHFVSDAFSVSFIDARRTAATRVWGRMTQTPNLGGVAVSWSEQHFTEFHAATP